MNVEKMIVTGATGFIGSRMVDFLKAKGHFVKAIVGSNGHISVYRKQWFEKADEIKSVDLRSQADTEKALKGYKYVFHFAADMGGVGYFSEAQYAPFINNMRIDLNIIEA